LKLRKIFLFLLLLVLLSTPALAAQEKARSIRLEKTEGTVTVLDAAGKTVAKLDGMHLYNSYQVQTGSDSYAWLSLDDTKTVKLDENTRLELRKHGKKTQLNLVSGSILVGANAHLEEDESLSIRTSTMVTGIRGTWVQADNSLVGDRVVASVFVLDGSVVSAAPSGDVSYQAGEAVLLDTEGTVKKRTLTAADIGTFAVQEVQENGTLRLRLDNDGLSGAGITADSLLSHGGTRKNRSEGGDTAAPQNRIRRSGKITVRLESSMETGEEEAAVTPHTHRWGEPGYVWNGDQCTATRVCLDNSFHIETETVTGGYVKDTDATCMAAETGHYAANFANAAFAARTTAKDSVTVGEPLAHDFSGDWTPVCPPEPSASPDYYEHGCVNDDCEATETELACLNRLLAAAAAETEPKAVEAPFGLINGPTGAGAEAKVLTIPAGTTLNAESLSVAEGYQVTVEGTLNITGTLTNAGIITVSGTLVLGEAPEESEELPEINAGGVNLGTVTVSERGRLVLNSTLDNQGTLIAVDNPLTECENLVSYGEKAALLFRWTKSEAALEDISAAMNAYCERECFASHELLTDLEIGGNDDLWISRNATFTVAEGVTLTVNGELELDSEMCVRGTVDTGTVEYDTEEAPGMAEWPQTGSSEAAGKLLCYGPITVEAGGTFRYNGIGPIVWD